MAQAKKPKRSVAQSSVNVRAPIAGDGGVASGEARRALKISTVSHTLDAVIAERLRYFAFRERISESAVIEFALREFLDSGDESDLGDRLRASGASLRRKT